MAVVAMTAKIAADPDRVWAVLTDYEHPFFPDVSKVTSHYQGTSRMLDFTVVRPVRLQYTVRMVERGRRRIDWDLISGDMKVNKGFIKLIPTKEGTQVLWHKNMSGIRGIPDQILPIVLRLSMSKALKALKRKVENGSN